MADDKKKSVKRNNKELVCKICGTSRGLLRKYDLMICRRCFKDNARKLGFEKMD